MAYTITARFYYSETSFRVVEKCGTWSEPTRGQYVLKMASSGTSGTLRLAHDGRNFHVTLGVHNYKPWGHITTEWQSAVSVNRGYYETEWGGTQNQAHCDARWKQMTSFDVTQNKVGCSFNYTVTEGSDLEVDIVII